MKNSTTNNVEKKSIIDSVSKNGKIFTIIYQKSHGVIRSINGRKGVTKYLKGGKSPIRNKESVMFGMKEKGKDKTYKSLKYEKVIEVRGCGKVIKF